MVLFKENLCFESWNIEFGLLLETWDELLPLAISIELALPPFFLSALRYRVGRRVMGVSLSCIGSGSAGALSLLNEDFLIDFVLG